MSPIGTDFDAERKSITALSDGQLDDPIDTTSSKDELAGYDTNAGAMVTMAKGKVKGSIVEHYDWIYDKCTRAKERNRIEEPLVNILSPGNRAALNQI